MRLELQADCYAGVWANHATETEDDEGEPLFKSITQQDIDEALEAAAGDRRRHDPEEVRRRREPRRFTHGTSAQRQQWFTTGFDNGDPKLCDTFTTNSL